MDRRNFLRSFLMLTGAAAAGTAAGVGILASEANAAQDLQPAGPAPDADLPAAGAEEAQQRRRGGSRRGGRRGGSFRGGRRGGFRGRSRWGHGRPYYGYNRPYWRPRRRCVWRRNRWGNLRRVCFW